MNGIPNYLAPLLINIIRYFLLAGIPFLIFYTFFPELFSKNKIQVRWAKSKDYIREIFHSIQTSVILGAVGLLILYTPLRGYMQIYDHLNDYPIWWVPMSIFLALIIHDTYFYWMHRAVHHPKLFRHIHLLHHKSFNPSPWASYSFHFMEAMLEALVAPLIFLLLPMHPIAIFFFTFTSFAMNVYGHLGYEIAPKWFRHSFLFEIMNTSTHHNLHHAKSRGNYGLYFRFWDRLMKTERKDYVQTYDNIQEKRFGLPKVNGVGTKKLLGVLFFLSLGGTTLSAQGSIQGEWRDDKLGAVIQIYEEEGKYYGKVISVDDPEDNAKLESREVIVMRDFYQKSDATYCCGTFFAPKRKITFEATLVLEEENKLIIKGQYKRLSGKRVLKRATDN